jgi:MinD-like ATPase involved in chromosome partitioning or flagellar assembly
MSKAINAESLELISTMWTVARAAPLAAGRGKMIAVVGGEGAGRTMMCVNLALVAARAGKRAVIVETTPSANAAHRALCAQPARFVRDVAAGVDVLDALCIGDDGVAVLAANGPITHTMLERQRLMRAIDRLTRHYDLVLVDCDPRGGPESRIFGREADRCLLVMHGDLAHVDEGARTVRALASIGIEEVSVVVGHARSSKDARAVFSFLCNATSLVPRTKLVHVADVAPVPFARSSVALKKLCATLIDAAQPPPVPGSFLARVADVFTRDLFADAAA